jgi:CRP-like cAMP-binding protein
MHDAADHFVTGLTESQLRVLDSLGHETSFEDNELIVVAGEESRLFFLLLTGSAAVEVASGFCTVFVQALGPGDAIGWSSLLHSHETLFQVRARERCTALCLEGAALARLCHGDPQLGVTLLERALRTVAGRVRGLESRLGEFCGFKRT